MPEEKEGFLSLELIQEVGRESMDRFECIKMEIFCVSKLNHQIKRQKKKKKIGSGKYICSSYDRQRLNLFIK